MAARQTAAPVATALGIVFGAVATLAIGAGAYLVFQGDTRYGYGSAVVGWAVAAAFMMCADLVRERTALSAARDSAASPTGSNAALRGPARRVAVLASYVLGTAGLAMVVSAVVFFVQGRAGRAWPALIGWVVLWTVSGYLTRRVSGQTGASRKDDRSDEQPVFETFFAGFIASAALALGGTTILHYKSDNATWRGWGLAVLGLGGLLAVGAVGQSIAIRRRSSASVPGSPTAASRQPAPRPRYRPRGWSREQAEGLVSLVPHQPADARPQSPAPATTLDRPDAARPQVDRLRRDLGDLAAEVRAQAARGLRQLDWAPSTDRDHVLLAVAEGRWQDAAHCGDLGLRALVAALTDRSLRAEIIPTLQASFDQAFPHLIDGLEDTSRDVRAAAADALVDLKMRSAEPLITMLRPGVEPETERIIVLLLGRMDESAAIEPLRARISRVRFLVDMAQGTSDVQHRNRLLAQAGALALARLTREDPHRLVSALQRTWADHDVNIAELQAAVGVVCDALRYIGDPLNELESLRASWQARGMLLAGGVTSAIDDALRWARWSSQQGEPSLLDSYDQVLGDALAAQPTPSALARPRLREWAAGGAVGVPGGVLAFAALTLVVDWAETKGTSNFLLEHFPKIAFAALVPTWTVAVARWLSRRRAARSRPTRRSLLD